MTIHPTIRGCAIALLGIVGVCAYASIRYQAQLANLVALVTASQTEALGVNWTKVRTSRKLAATVPALADELARAKKAGTKPVLGVNVHSGDTAFHIPDWSPCGTSTLPGGPVEAGAANPPSSPPLLVSAEAQGAITAMADGTIRQRWKMFATLKRGDWTETRELEDVHADLAVDPAFETLLKTYGKPTPAFVFVHPPKLWRTGLSCGLELGYGVTLSVASLPGVTVGVGCLYGVQF